MVVCIRLAVHLALLFNCFIRHNYLPPSLTDSVIIPSVKNKHGDLTSTDNYRAIMISNAISKILESIMLDLSTNHVDVNEFQFGFKNGHSTDICTHTLKSTVEYYRRRGSHVFVFFCGLYKSV